MGIAKYTIRRGRVLLRTGRDRLDDVQAHHRAKQLLRDIGLAVYTQGSEDPEAVSAALAKLDAHLRAHPVDLDTGGLRGYLNAATGARRDQATDEPPMAAAPRPDGPET